MTFKLRFSKGFIRGVLAVALGVPLGGSAHAITSDSFTYSSSKTGYYSLSPAAFTPENQTIKYSKLAGLQTFLQSLTDTPASNNACFTAGVNLPQGATIVAVVYWYGNLTVAQSPSPAFGLIRHGLADGATLFLVALGSESRMIDRTSTYAPVVPASVVNNGPYTYMAKVCLGYGDLFFGARILYTYKNAGG